MSLRNKIILFNLAFFAVMSILGIGAFLIIDRFGDNLAILSDITAKEKAQNELSVSMTDMINDAEQWASTQNPAHRTKYEKSVYKVRDSLSILQKTSGDIHSFTLLIDEFEELVALSKPVIASHKDTNPTVLQSDIKMMEVQHFAVMMRVRELERIWADTIGGAVSAGESLREDMTYYLILLISFSLTAAGFIVIIMKRAIEAPYNVMLKATEKVTGGDLSYRIGSKRTDEFGIIAGRFDAMVGSMDVYNSKINAKLKETELYLSVSQIASTLPEHTETIGKIVETIAEKMNKAFCAVFEYKPEEKLFEMDACSMSVKGESKKIPVSFALPRDLLSGLKPVVADNVEKYPEIKDICSDVESVMAVPILREHNCIGMMVIGSYESKGFTKDEVDAVSILAHSVGSAIRNIQLYEETSKQLDQLGMVYELSKTLTSVYETDVLLKTITAMVAKQLNARGCTIRLIEGDMLRIKSFSGQMEDITEDMEVPLGKGVAGWVAREGKPLLVEDVNQIPDYMKAPVLAKKSAISVPLKKDERIIGTLGLYDKLDSSGNAISFTLDDLKVAEGFASISAIAIENTRMKEQEINAVIKIQEAKKRIDLLFESVQSGIITLDSEYNITAANRYVERWVDEPLEKIISSNALQVFHDKGGICPHCAARATFQDGSINTITQSNGLNFADLSSYPVKDDEGNVTEAVVVMQDITDRVLYQEEIMGLYREVMQTKEYMESLINNSADAIVTSDINGVIKSWNPAADAIFGFSNDEAIGRFLPFIPETLVEYEKDNIERIKKGEVLRLETFRQRKDGSILEVSVTLSPIKDVGGDIIGITGITRDITDKKRVEKELVRRNQELSRLFFISSAMRGTLDLDRLLRMVLTTVTMSDGLGFNRAILFLMDDEGKSLKGVMGVGPASLEEAWHVWERLSMESRSMKDMMQEIMESPIDTTSFLNKLSSNVEIPIDGDSVLARVAKNKTPINVLDIRKESYSDTVLLQQLGTEAFAAVPLVSKDKVIGALWVDNLFNKKPISDEDIKFLRGFADQVSSAIEAARLFQKVSLAEAELENIFRSISDMVYITDEQYTIKSVNQAVVDRVGLPREKIIGNKCYRIFHGMDEPWPSCPHHKTVQTMKPYIEEIEDPHLKSTFLTSTSPIFDTAKHFIGTVHLVRDVSELKALREKLQSAERMAALGEVAAKVAHEIRNPLVSVGGFAKRLENKLDGSLQEYARIISNEVKRLEHILKDILGFVRDVRINLRSVDLNALIEDIIELMQVELLEHGNKIERDYHMQPVEVLIDPDRLREAMINIITNANQATDNGTVSIKTRMEEGFGVMEVSDSGVGIRDEDMQRIFDPFYTTRPTGTGLGLAIAKRIVEEHDGKIQVKTGKPGEGATFIIYLPLKEG